MEISTVIFDFGGVLTTGSFFHLLAKNLSDKFEVNLEEIKKRLYANEKAYARGEETTEDFWKKCFPEVEIGKKGEECIFIDDKEKNLIAPAKIGIHTLLFKGPEQLLIDIRKLGVKI